MTISLHLHSGHDLTEVKLQQLLLSLQTAKLFKIAKECRVPLQHSGYFVGITITVYVTIPFTSFADVLIFSFNCISLLSESIVLLIINLSTEPTYVPSYSSISLQRAIDTSAIKLIDLLLRTRCARSLQCLESWRSVCKFM